MRTYSESSSGVVSRSLANGFFEVRLGDGETRVCFVGPALKASGTVVQEGDRVSVGAEEDGVFHGEITRVRPEAAAPREEEAPRASLISRSDAPDLKPQDQRIDPAVRPDWAPGADCPPQAGDLVYCTAGVGTVLRVLGRTGNGSRLLELRLPGGGKTSFFAASSNVLVAPRQAASSPESVPGGA